MIKIRVLLVTAVFVLITGLFLSSNVVFGATSGTFKISGNVEPDLTSTNSIIKSGFKVEVVGTSYSAVSDNNGYFELLNLPVSLGAVIKVKISKAGYLRKELSNLFVSSEVIIGSKESPIKMWPGDLPVNNVQDDAINFLDVLQIAKSYNCISSDGRYNASCDFNLDNVINVTDVIAMARHFNAITNSYVGDKVSYIAAAYKPDPPQNLKALWNTGSTISLSWDAPNSAKIANYEVYCNDKIVATTTSTNIICVGLTPNKVNTVYIKSVDSSNNRSDASNILNIKTPEDDNGNSIDTSTPIECEKEVVASFETNDTVDYFRFKAQKSGTFSFKMYVGFLVNAYLYDSSGRKIADVTYSSFNLEAGKNYYIEVENAYTVGEYRFIIIPKVSKPEIVVDELYIDKLWVNQPNLLKVKVINIGDATASGSFRISFDIDGQKNMFWTDCSSDITPDSAKFLDVTGSINGVLTWTSSVVGYHTISINIDTQNKINEVYENNNTFTYNVFLDDYADNENYAMEIQAGQDITGCIGTSSDEDYFSFTPKTTGNYLIEMPGSKYTNFFIYDEDFNQVAKTGIIYKGSGRDSCYASAQLSANNKYYIDVKTADMLNFVSETYTLRITKTS
ncbi:MAG: CARDB domain-containing protein [Bacillota bacterium]|nr:CARDB domain-containing protein [Bacillota bacterium]